MAETTMRLSDLCDFVGLQVDPATRADDVYVGLEHVASGRFVMVVVGKASDIQSAKYVFRPGDVLYGKLRPYLDKAVLATEAGICTTELLVLRPKEGVDPRFVVGVVHAPSFVDHAVAGTTGVQHPRTSWSHIGDFQLPAFKPAEQVKIANLLWEVHGAITANEAAVETGADLKRTAMRELFTRGLRGEAQKESQFGLTPEAWPVSPIGGFTTQTQYGLSVRGEGEGRYPILRMNCQQDGKVLMRDLQYVDLDERTAAVYRLYAGDVLFNRTNSYELVGRTAILESDTDAVFASYLVRVAVDKERLDPRYLNHFLNWEVAQSELKKLASRGVSQANISASKLRDFAIPIPPTLDEQYEIVAILDAIDRKIDLHKRKRAVLEDLFKALLHKLMTGEIRVADLDLSALKTTEASA
jgi:type I restriction enzyme S subunit